MSDLTHRSLSCKAHLSIPIENALYKFITNTIVNSLSGHTSKFCFPFSVFFRICWLIQIYTSSKLIESNVGLVMNTRKDYVSANIGRVALIFEQT